MSALQARVQQPTAAGVWGSAHSYEPYMGRWSAQIAQQFLAWLAPADHLTWLDVGCGTGALTQAIVQRTAASAVHGVDPSPAYLAYARERLQTGTVSLSLGDAHALPVLSASYDMVVSGLVFNFLSHPTAAARELARAAKPGARVAAYVWDYGEGMQLLRAFWDVACKLDPSVSARDEAVRSQHWRPDVMQAIYEAAGLLHVQTAAFSVRATFASFDDYWRPFCGGQGTVASYAMGLPADRREQLKAALRAQLEAAGTPIELTLRAFAVQGARPEDAEDL